MLILITGSSGEIGTNLSLKLQEMGHKVTGIDKRPNTWTDKIPTILQDLSVKYTNFSGGIGYTPYPSGIDLVVHLAANAKVHELVKYPSRAMDNITVTFNVAEFCRQNNLPIIFSSSREVYGDINRFTTDEKQSDFFFTESPYSASKISGEALIYSYAKCYNLPYIVFRFSNVYGRYDSDIERMERVTPLFIKKIWAGEPVVIFGKDKVLDFTYIDDCVSGIISGIQKLSSGEVKNKTVNLAYGEGHTLVELAEYIGKALGKTPQMVVEESKKVGEVARYIADLTQAKNILGYNPQTNLENGVKKSVDWWLENEKIKDLGFKIKVEDKKKTIVIFSAFYEPFMSGAERFVKEITERLADKYNIVIVTAKLRKDLKDEEDFGRYKVVRVGRGDVLDKLRYVYLAPLAAKKFRPVLLHAVMESYAGLALWRAKKVMSGIPRILTLQSGDLDKKFWRKVPWLWKTIHTSPDFITAISNFLADRARKLGAKKIEVVPNGVDLGEANDVLVNKENRSADHRIVCLARLSWEKDHKNLVAAMPKIFEKYPDAEMVFVGDGPLLENLRLQILDLRLEDKIKLLGKLPHKTALEELAKADVSICPSLAEGLGITFIESQILGVPVIGTRVGGIPDVIEDGKTGFLIEPNSSRAISEAIIKVFSMSAEEKEKMIFEAKKSAEQKFNWDNIAKKVDELYEKLLRESGKNILICTGIYPPDIGGPATYSKLISEELSERNYAIQVLTCGEPEFPSSPPATPGGSDGGRGKFQFPNKYPISNIQYPIFFVSRKYPLPIRYFLYFLKVLKLGKNADVIYVQDPVSVGLPAALANLFLRKKMILKIVGDYSWETSQQVQSSKFKVQRLDEFYPFEKENYPFKINLLNKIQNWVAKRADKIITPSFYLKNILMKGWGIDEKKIKVIYNSFDVPTVIARSEATRQSPPFKILSVGRLVPWKGFNTLIEAVKDIPDVELEIIGDGPLLENLRFKILDLRLEDRAKLLGKLSHEEVVQKIYLSHLFVLNTAYEGLSHVILEAMACGLPVAVSRAGGNAELVGENEERGYLFDYNNKEQIKEKMNYIMAHPEEAREKAKKASAFGGDFSKDKMIEELEKELKD